MVLVFNFHRSENAIILNLNFLLNLFEPNSIYYSIRVNLVFSFRIASRLVFVFGTYKIVEDSEMLAFNIVFIIHSRMSDCVHWICVRRLIKVLEHSSIMD